MNQWWRQDNKIELKMLSLTQEALNFSHSDSQNDDNKTAMNP